METSDLLSALRVAARACLSAEKEAAWAKDALTESVADESVVRTAQQEAEVARLHILAALTAIGAKS